MRRRRRQWKRQERPWYECHKKRKIPKTEFNRKDVEEGRRQKRIKKRAILKKIKEQLDANN